MNDRITKITLVLAIAIPWAFLMVTLKGARTFFICAPIVVIFYLVIYVFPSYLLFRRFSRILESQEGVIISHNGTYTEFTVSHKGIRIDISTFPGSRGVSRSITFSTKLIKPSCFAFSISPYDCYDKLVRNMEKKFEVTSNEKLILDNKFKMTGNNISSLSVEQLFSRVIQDLIDFTKSKPEVEFHSQTLVMKFHRLLDKTHLVRYLQIVHCIVAGLSEAAEEHTQLTKENCPTKVLS